MNYTTQALVAFAVSTCGNGGSCASEQSYTPNSSGDFSCYELELMANVEMYVGDNCQTDSECTQIVYGTGCGCETDDLIASSSFDLVYFYEYLEQADEQGCSLDFGTTCDCPVDATPVCIQGTCTWSD